MGKQLWLLVCFVCTLPSLNAQSVGLVLSGGGSKGLAHIGVIKALEEQEVPIDCIGGTSMGAIVGALYAMGMTPDQMIEIIGSDDFRSWLSGEIDVAYKYYFKEENPAPDLIRMGLDIKDTVPRTRFPLSLIPNHIMDFAFMEVFAQASAAAGYNFDSLFVPYLCNAVDISNSEEIVFRRGDLTQAVRASMTVPVYFRPIVMDDRILYDGGIYNNFPVNHVKKEFRPDILIGSKAAKGNITPDEFDLLTQIEKIVMKPSEYHIGPEEGVLLDMDFRNTSLLAFDRMDEFVQIGYDAAMEKMESLKILLRGRQKDSLQLREERAAFRAKLPEFKFRDIEVSGLNEEQTEYIQRNIRKSDSIIGMESLKVEYMKLAHDPSLVYLYPRAIYDRNDSLFRLHLRVIPEAPLEARFGLFISTTGHAQTYLGFSYREIAELSTHLLGSIQFGRLYNGFNVGFRFDYPSRIPVYFQGSFNYNGFDYNAYNSNFFFEDLKPSYITEDEINFRFDVGIPWQINGVIKGGLGIGRNHEIYYMTRDFTSDDTSDVSHVNLISLYGALERNSLNDRQFATEGMFRKLSLRAGYGLESYMPGSTSMDRINGRMNYSWLSATLEEKGYLPLQGKWSLGYYFQLHASFKRLLSNYYATIIEAPSFRPTLISQSMFMENYRAHQFVAAGVMPVYRFSDLVHAKVEAYGFFPVQEILLGENNDAELGHYFKSMKSLFNASLNVVTVAGPLGVHLGYLTEQEKPWVIQLSFGYLLFNKRSTDD
ncbi:MAG: patatin-like phospholipase family protein [Bacteroidales bacterium]